MLAVRFPGDVLLYLLSRTRLVLATNTKQHFPPGGGEEGAKRSMQLPPPAIDRFPFDRAPCGPLKPSFLFSPFFSVCISRRKVRGTSNRPRERVVVGKCPWEIASILRVWKSMSVERTPYWEKKYLILVTIITWTRTIILSCGHERGKEPFLLINFTVVL